MQNSEEKSCIWKVSKQFELVQNFTHLYCFLNLHLLPWIGLHLKVCRSIKYALYRPKTILDLSKTFWLVQNVLDTDQDAKLLVVFGMVQNNLDGSKILSRIVCDL